MTKATSTLLSIPLVACMATGQLSANPSSAPASWEPELAEGTVPVEAPQQVDTWEPPGRWTLAERQAWSALREEALIYLKDANEHCGGTKIEVDFDHESFRGRFKEGERAGLDAYGRAHVQAPIAAVDNICKIGDREKKAVADGIRKIKFVHGKPSKDAKSTISLAGRVLVPVIQPDGEAAGSWQDVLERWIKTKL